MIWRQVQRRKYDESDGRCCMATKHGCAALKEAEDTCGTYRCPFYKPKGCKDWIRRDREKKVLLIPPEDYYKGNVYVSE